MTSQLWALPVAVQTGVGGGGMTQPAADAIAEQIVVGDEVSPTEFAFHQPHFPDLADSIHEPTSPGRLDLDGYVPPPQVTRPVLPHSPELPPKNSFPRDLSSPLLGAAIFRIPRAAALLALKLPGLSDDTRRQILQSYDWQDVNLDGCRFPRNMDGINLRGAILGQEAMNYLCRHSGSVSLAGARVENVVFKWFEDQFNNIEVLDFAGALLSKVTFEKMNISRDFRNAKFYDVVFRGTNLDGVNFKGVEVGNVLFERCHLSGVSFAEASMPNKSFPLTFRNCTLYRGGFRSCQFGNLIFVWDKVSRNPDALENYSAVVDNVSFSGAQIQNLSISSQDPEVDVRLDLLQLSEELVKGKIGLLELTGVVLKSLGKGQPGFSGEQQGVSINTVRFHNVTLDSELNLGRMAISLENMEVTGTLNLVNLDPDHLSAVAEVLIEKLSEGKSDFAVKVAPGTQEKWREIFSRYKVNSELLVLTFV